MLEGRRRLKISWPVRSRVEPTPCRARSEVAAPPAAESFFGLLLETADPSPSSSDFPEEKVGAEEDRERARF